MGVLRSIRLIRTFYRSIWIPTTLVSIACSSIIFLNGLSAFKVLFWFKVITEVIIYFFINERKKQEYYYYLNLGIPKRLLWIPVFAANAAVFVILVIASFYLR